MSGVRKRAAKVAPANTSARASKKNQAKTSKSSKGLSTCFKSLLFAIIILGAVALFGYYRAPFTALTITEYAEEIKLEGKFALNTKLATGTRSVL